MRISHRIFLRQALWLIVLAVPAAMLTGLLHPRGPVWGELPLEPWEIRLETALSWEGALWLDARSRAEFEEGHIPGALLLNEDEWEGLFFDLVMVWEPDQRIIVYCGGSQCQASHAVAERLRLELGSDEIYVLKGGWSEWVREGGGE